MRIIFLSFILFLIPVGFSSAQTSIAETLGVGTNVPGSYSLGQYIDNSYELAGFPDYWVFEMNQPVEGCEVGTVAYQNSYFTADDGVTWTGFGGSSQTCSDVNGYYSMQDIANPAVGWYFTSGTGYYVYGWSNVSSAPENLERYAIVYYDSSAGTFTVQDDGTVAPPTNGVSTGDPTNLTRFLDGSLTGTSKSAVTLHADYFLQLSEFAPNTRPDVLNVMVVEEDTFTNVLTQQSFIYPLNQGTSTKSLLLNNVFDKNKTYLVYVNFWNLFNNNIAQNQTQLTLRLYFDINENVFFDILAIDDAYLLPTDGSLLDLGSCSFSDLSACITAPLAYLFIPSSDSVSSLLSTIQNSDNPLLQSAVTSFNNIIGLQNATPDGNQLAYRLQIAEAGIDVEMVSINTITQLFGDSQPMFRGIMILVIWLSFFSMIISSVWNRFSPGDAYDFVPDADGTGAKRQRNSGYINRN